MNKLELSVFKWLVGIASTVALAWAGWVSLSLYTQNGTLSSVAQWQVIYGAKIDDIASILQSRTLTPVNKLVVPTDNITSSR